MLSITYKLLMLSVIMLIFIMLIVVAPASSILRVSILSVLMASPNGRESAINRALDESTYLS
jgi:hypothetical protein